MVKEKTMTKKKEKITVGTVVLYTTLVLIGFICLYT